MPEPDWWYVASELPPDDESSREDMAHVVGEAVFYAVFAACMMLIAWGIKSGV